MKSAEKLYLRLSRLQPTYGDPPAIRVLLSRAEIALILPALKQRYEIKDAKP